jgi:hypothetical protein
MRRTATFFIVLVTVMVAARASAQITLYDDGLQNGFQNYSYGGNAGDINFDGSAQVYSGAKSISFTGRDFNAVAFAHPTVDYTAAAYPTVHFWVHGGAAGGQQLRIYLELNNFVVAQAELDSFITGGAIAANEWREVTVPINGGVLGYSGSYDRVDIQSDVAGTQAILYIDQVTLETAGVGSNLMQIERDVVVSGMESDRFSWLDRFGSPRVAVLAHNDGQVGPTAGVYANRGGALRQFQYTLPNSTVRTLGVTNYGNGGYGGFGYVVSHRGDGSSGGIGDDSPLGYSIAGSFQRVFEGRHHAIFRFTQNYPRYSSTTANPPNTLYQVPVTIDWMFASGRDNPVWAITYDLSGVPVNALNDDSRAPYGELVIDGSGATNISGVAWGDRYKFTACTGTNPCSPVGMTNLTLNSDWTWNVANTVPWVKLWIASTDATMGLVQTQTMTQQDAGGGRNPFYHDMTVNWGKTSADGNAGGTYKMPYQGEWPYQANAYSITTSTGNSNARLTWGTQYGFLGQQNYTVNDGVVNTAPGWPKKSYSTYVVMGAHSAGPVETQLSLVEQVSNVTLTASVGSVMTSGPAGVNRTDNVTYSPAGYNHVYGAWAVAASGNKVDANVSVSVGELSEPLFIISNYTGALPTSVKYVLGATTYTLVQDVDYFPSLRPDASELWLSLDRSLPGSMNRIQINITSAWRGDFNSDNKPDIVLRNYATGQNAIWVMNGASLAGIVDLPALPNTNYRIEGVADFNQDGSNDIVLRNYATGQNALWIMNGSTLTSIVDLPALPNLNYHIEGTGDFNADGKPDIILRNYATGQNALWIMNGTSLTAITDLPALPNTAYRIESAGDFNNDSKTDIVLRNYATGQNAVWLMNGTSIVSIKDLPALPNTNYRIDGVGDIIADGRPDIIWRNYSTGQNAVWRMDGTRLIAISDLPALANTSYEINGPR